MHHIQQQAYHQAILQAQQAILQQQWAAAMAQLKRAHVLGQLAVWPHVYTHWLMLVVAWQQRQFGAVVGQLIRMVLGVIGSAVGKVPTGNTGDSEISMFLSLPIDPELQQIMDGKTADSAHLSTNPSTNPSTHAGSSDDQAATTDNNHKQTSA